MVPLEQRCVVGPETANLLEAGKLEIWGGLCGFIDRLG
jgi:hypothetical protein